MGFTETTKPVPSSSTYVFGCGFTNTLTNIRGVPAVCNPAWYSHFPARDLLAFLLICLIFFIVVKNQEHQDWPNGVVVRIVRCGKASSRAPTLCKGLERCKHP